MMLIVNDKRNCDELNLTFKILDPSWDAEGGAAGAVWMFHAQDHVWGLNVSLSDLQWAPFLILSRGSKFVMT